MPDPTYYSGASGFLTVYDSETDATTEHPCSDFTVPLTTRFITRNNMKNAPFQDGVGGFSNCDFTVKIQYSSLFGEAPVRSGGTYHFTLGLTEDGPKEIAVRAFVETISVNNPAEGAPDATLNCKSRGEFQLATP